LVTRIILVRHGESSFNVERRVQGHYDESLLTESGREMAQKVGQALGNLNFDLVLSSPLKRARETAELICAQLQANGQQPLLKLMDELKEISLPQWEGKLFKEVKATFPEQYQQWHETPEQLCMKVESVSGPEDYYPVRDLYDRARRFWEAFLPAHQGKTILLVAHSGINRALIGSAVGLTPEYYQAINQANCGISILNFSGVLGDRVQYESLNLTAHVGMPLPKTRPEHNGPRLLLVRHGETDWNRDKRFQGQVDVPLNDNGRAQGRLAADFLASVKLDAAFTSSMLRPKETAEIILERHPGIELQALDDLREISHGLWEGRLEDEIETITPGLLDQWQKAPETVQMPEGENLAQVWERAIAGWRKILRAVDDPNSPWKTVLVVAHDAVNKAILCSLFDLDPSYFWTFKQGNGAVSVIDYPRGIDQKPVLQAMNITSHLPGGVLDQTAAGAL